MWWALISIFGVVIGHRTGMILLKIRSFDRRLQLFLHFALMICALIISCMCRNTPIFHIFAILILIFLPLIVAKTIEVQRRSQIFQLRISILDNLVCRLRSGIPLGKAIREQTEFLPDWLRPTWRLHLENYSYQVALDNPIHKLLQELHQIDVMKSRQLDRLENLRQRYRLEQKFRRKSRVATQQTRSQAAIVSIFYVSCCVWHIFADGLTKFLPLALISVLLFFSGIIWILSMGRRYRWKV